MSQQILIQSTEVSLKANANFFLVFGRVKSEKSFDKKTFPENLLDQIKN